MEASTNGSRVRAETERHPEQFRVPLLLFGIGLGGFFDGIVLHQMLQWPT
jgi:uncharacterized membrane protein